MSISATTVTHMTPSTPVGIPASMRGRGLATATTHVMVEVEMLIHQSRGAIPADARCLVDRHIPDMSSRGRVLTGIELASLRQ